MANRKRVQAPDYVVGFRRPPQATQFKKGESGNPKGRPKGSRSIGAVLQEILQQKIAVTESGRTRRLPALEVMLRRLRNDAMRSEPAALKLILSLFDRYGESPAAGLRFDEILAEDQAILAEFLKPLTSVDGAGGKPKKGGKHDA